MTRTGYAQVKGANIGAVPTRFLAIIECKGPNGETFDDNRYAFKRAYISNTDTASAIELTAFDTTHPNFLWSIATDIRANLAPFHLLGVGQYVEVMQASTGGGIQYVIA